MTGARLVTPALDVEGGIINLSLEQNTLEVTTTFKASSSGDKSAVISGTLVLGGARTLTVGDGPEPGKKLLATARESGADKAHVRVSYLRESGAPIVKEYEVPATSRFNIDVKAEVPELASSSFGADIEVLDEVPIAVERSLCWNTLGVLWSGVTNALATPLQQAK